MSRPDDPIKNCASARVNTNYIPELSEVRMVQRAPDYPFELSGDDAEYLERSLRDVEKVFGFDAFPGVPFSHISARALMKQFIDWWRGIEPESDEERDALGRLPSAIRLMDTISTWMQESGHRH